MYAGGSEGILMVNQLRAYIVTIINNHQTLSAAGDFPAACPECGAAWQIGESWIDNGTLQSGGREACCTTCGCNTFEVIDRVPVKPSNGLYFVDRLVPAREATG
jgi:hypothetical protein